MLDAETMKKVREFRRRAKECRTLASKATGDVRAHYEQMAETWDKLANERLTFFVEHPEEDTEGEVAEDVADSP
jgi:hypothetical protein